ncbi:MAG: UPF0175 family protein [Nitrospirae bacterium]|nr:UPF0175 family protein [Nitrospirota bacterium]
MKAIKLKDNLYKEVEKVSKVQGIKVEELISKALKQGLYVINEKSVLELYSNRKISLQKAASLLSIDIWEMIDKVKKADIHIDYSLEELSEDLSNA